MMAGELKEDILSAEPRITDVEIDVTPQFEIGRLLLSVNYTVADGHTADSLVFPFYLNEASGEPEEETIL